METPLIGEWRTPRRRRYRPENATTMQSYYETRRTGIANRFGMVAASNRRRRKWPRSSSNDGFHRSRLSEKAVCGLRRLRVLVQAFPDRVVNEVSQGMQAQLQHDFSPVCLDCPDGDSQQWCDLLVHFSVCQKADNFDLARCWLGACPLAFRAFFGLEKSIQHDFGHFRR